MWSLRQPISVVRRTGMRYLGSVLPEVSIPDFEFKNEPTLDFIPCYEDYPKLLKVLNEMKQMQDSECPITIGEKEYRTDDVRYQVLPHNHSHRLTKFYYADSKLIKEAVDTAVSAQGMWEKVPLAEKLNIWNRAADLMATKYRMELIATTMLGQSKTIIQAEIDAAAELIDFFRYNAYHAKELLRYQPISVSPKSTLNSMRYRGLEGFVASISPFNFTAIGGNLAYTPALMGNCVVWKPSDTAMLSNYTIFKILKEAGLPPGVVNFVPADGPLFGDIITSSQHLAAINFTGSVATFNVIWKLVGNNIGSYRSYPRLIGECGGKNYHFVHPSASVDNVVFATIRSAFEYSGQKCSACSRLYVPESLWPKMKPKLQSILSEMKVGDPCKRENFMGAVIDAKAFARLQNAIKNATSSSETQLVSGGVCDDSIGYFVTPTIVETKDPHDPLMTTELFGPVLAVFVYKDNEIDAALQLVDSTSPYALTGAIFANDEKFLKKAVEVLKMSCGNMYVNDKSTGSVVGQQPFGGSRLSGTNDKAGGPHYLLRFTSPQSVKETFYPLKEWKYTYMDPKYDRWDYRRKVKV